MVGKRYIDKIYDRHRDRRVCPGGGGGGINEPTKDFYIIGENSGCFEESGESI
jgi:hypothetical protein